MSEKKFKIIMICGSHQAESKTRMVMQQVIRNFSASPVSMSVVDPGASAQEPGDVLRAAAQETQLAGKVAAADAVIFCTPEYNGSYSALIKVIVENLGYPSALSGKPVALLGIAAGAIGAVKALEHLQSMCLHNGALVVPPFVSIPLVNLHFDKQGICTNEKIAAQLSVFSESLLRFLRHHRR
jgi:FMN reductase